MVDNEGVVEVEKFAGCEASVGHADGQGPLYLSFGYKLGLFVSKGSGAESELLGVRVVVLVKGTNVGRKLSW